MNSDRSILEITSREDFDMLVKIAEANDIKMLSGCSLEGYDDKKFFFSGSGFFDRLSYGSYIDDSDKDDNMITIRDLARHFNFYDTKATGKYTADYVKGNENIAIESSNDTEFNKVAKLIGNKDLTWHYKWTTQRTKERSMDVDYYKKIGCEVISAKVFLADNDASLIQKDCDELKLERDEITLEYLKQNIGKRAKIVAGNNTSEGVITVHHGDTGLRGEDGNMKKYFFFGDSVNICFDYAIFYIGKEAEAITTIKSTIQNKETKIMKTNEIKLENDLTSSLTENIAVKEAMQKIETIEAELARKIRVRKLAETDLKDVKEDITKLEKEYQEQAKIVKANTKAKTKTK